MSNRYPPETLDPHDDDGTMPENVEALASNVVGHRIVSAEERDDLPTGRKYAPTARGLRITLDNGKQVDMHNTSDCCAYTALDDIVLNLDRIDHIITGVGTTDGFTTWHIYADLGDVMQLKVGWSCGNPFYYGYGFGIVVRDAEDVS